FGAGKEIGAVVARIFIEAQRGAAGEEFNVPRDTAGGAAAVILKQLEHGAGSGGGHAHGNDGLLKIRFGNIHVADFSAGGVGKFLRDFFEIGRASCREERV